MEQYSDQNLTIILVNPLFQNVSVTNRRSASLLCQTSLTRHLTIRQTPTTTEVNVHQLVTNQGLLWVTKVKEGVRITDSQLTNLMLLQQ